LRRVPVLVLFDLCGADAYSDEVGHVL